ncbi:MAG: hypothetical protein FJW34_16705 [Acidobacteria bacterium]|nr:hypothetical protein [Acidobacteriota bacterium]
MTAKEELHQLIEALPEADVHAARRFLEFLSSANDDPFLRALREAPEDDEPIGSEEDRSAQEGWEEYRRGQAREWEEVRAELAHD